jgi:hypothetical protein
LCRRRPGGIELLACNDDDPGAGAQSRLSFNAEPGTAYYFQAGGKAGATGTLSSNVVCAGPGCGGVEGPETGPGQGGGGPLPQAGGPGPIAAPDTGSGGYR